MHIPVNISKKVLVCRDLSKLNETYSCSEQFTQAWHVTKLGNGYLFSFGKQMEYFFGWKDSVPINLCLLAHYQKHNIAVWYRSSLSQLFTCKHHFAPSSQYLVAPFRTPHMFCTRSRCDTSSSLVHLNDENNEEKESKNKHRLDTVPSQL